MFCCQNDRVLTFSNRSAVRKWSVKEKKKKRQGANRWRAHSTHPKELQLQKMFPAKDTVDNSSSLDVSPLADMQLDKLAKAAGVVVVHSLGVSEGLHDGTMGLRGSVMVNGGSRTSEKKQHSGNQPALQ